MTSARAVRSSVSDAAAAAPAPMNFRLEIDTLAPPEWLKSSRPSKRGAPCFGFVDAGSLPRSVPREYRTGDFNKVLVLYSFPLRMRSRQPSRPKTLRLVADVPRVDLSGPTRRERDLLGERDVPVGALYGIQTLRAIENFCISGIELHEFPTLVAALATVKEAAALANLEMKLIDRDIIDAICQAASEIREGLHHEFFRVDMIQGGAGTSSNMNANEVMAKPRAGDPRQEARSVRVRAPEQSSQSQPVDERRLSDRGEARAPHEHLRFAAGDDRPRRRVSSQGRRVQHLHQDGAHPARRSAPASTPRPATPRACAATWSTSRDCR